MKRFAATTLALCLATAASADGTTLRQHITCAVFAQLSRFPLARMEGAARVNAEAARLRDKHISEALQIGVPLTDEDGSSSSDLLRLSPLGGSSEAGIGSFFANSVILEDQIYERRHGAPQTDARSMDARFDQLADWYRARAAYMTQAYEFEGCAELPWR